MWVKILNLIFGSASVVVSNLATPAVKPPTYEEILTYDCARKAVDMAETEVPLGPVFHKANLVFTSIQGSNGNILLVANAGSGTYSAELSPNTVNRFKFTIPAGDHGTMTTYYMAYFHDESLRSRVVDFAVDRPPQGKDELDFMNAPMKRSEYLLGHLEFALFKTVENTVEALKDKRISPHQVKPLAPDTCAHIEHRSPSIADNLKFKFQTIATLVHWNYVAGAKNRLPASYNGHH